MRCNVPRASVYFYKPALHAGVYFAYECVGGAPRLSMREAANVDAHIQSVDILLFARARPDAKRMWQAGAARRAREVRVARIYHARPAHTMRHIVQTPNVAAE